MRSRLPVIQYLFWFLLMIFPFGLILAEHAREFFNILVNGSPTDYFRWLPVVGDGRLLLLGALGIFIILLIWGAKDTHGWVEKFLSLPESIHLLMIFSLAIGIRYYFIVSVDTMPISDFALIHKDAQAISLGEDPSRMYVSTHVMVTMIYGTLYRLFGINILLLKLFNALLYAFASVLMYLVISRDSGSRAFGLVGGVLLACWPSLAIYTNVLTPEHFFIFFLAIFMYLLVAYFYKGYSGMEAKPLHYALIAIITGIMSWFRPFGILFFIMFTGVTIYYAVDKKKSTIYVLAGLLIYVLVNSVPGYVADHYSNTFVNLRPCNLLVGLNVDTAGQYNEADVDLCKRLLEESKSDNEFLARTVQFSLNRLADERDQLLKFIVLKFGVLWANGNGIIYWAFQPLPEMLQKSHLADIANNTVLLDFVCMFIGSLSCFIGLIFGRLRSVSPMVVFCLVVFTGFNLMEIPFEVQTRYRTVVMPVYIFITCWGIMITRSFLRKLPEVPLAHKG